jgi:hypothetical protein
MSGQTWLLRKAYSGVWNQTASEYSLLEPSASRCSRHSTRHRMSAGLIRSSGMPTRLHVFTQSRFRKTRRYTSSRWSPKRFPTKSIYFVSGFTISGPSGRLRRLSCRRSAAVQAALGCGYAARWDRRFRLSFCICGSSVTTSQFSHSRKPPSQGYPHYASRPPTPHKPDPSAPL